MVELMQNVVSKEGELDAKEMCQLFRDDRRAKEPLAGVSNLNES